MKRTLVEFLRDPVSGEPLTLSDATLDGEEIVSGKLSAKSGAVYPVDGGVPALVRADQFSEGQKETVDSFSWKWQNATNYRSSTLGHYLQWYLDRYGFGTEAKLAEFLSNKTRILDAGTAHGRDAEMYSRNTKATIFGLDISYGVRTAYKDLGKVANLNFVQGDLTRLPFSEGFFDFIACDQVIHHTPNTRESLRHLCTRLAPGGHINFYVYKVKAPTREFCTIRRSVTNTPLVRPRSSSSSSNRMTGVPRSTMVVSSLTCSARCTFSMVTSRMKSGWASWWSNVTSAIRRTAVTGSRLSTLTDCSAVRMRA